MSVSCGSWSNYPGSEPDQLRATRWSCPRTRVDVGLLHPIRDRLSRRFELPTHLSRSTTCFDKLNHDLILSSIRRRVTDGSILALVKMFLVSGVMIEGNWEATELGSPQGGVVSPLIANIYLDAFDQEMKRRGHRIVRYADDILILCRSKTGAQHALCVATAILECDLKLTINRDKTHVTHAGKGVKFLGVLIGSVHTRIAPNKVVDFKAKVKRITRRTSPVNLAKVIAVIAKHTTKITNFFIIVKLLSKTFELKKHTIKKLLPIITRPLLLIPDPIAKKEIKH